MSEVLGPGWKAPANTDFPSSWEISQLRDVCSFQQGGKLGLTKELDYASTGVPAYSAAGQDGYVADSEFRDTSAVVLSAIGANCGRCFLAEGEFTTLANIQVIIPDERKLEARFLHYRVNREQYWPRSGSAQPFIKPRDMKDCWIAYPEVKQQSKIAEILDTLDAAIRGTEAVVAKLKAMKRGLLHDLLTRGIDANGDLRPPQTEAPHLYKQTPLGWLPKEWDVAELGEITNLITSGSRGWARFYSDDGQLFVRSQNVRMGHLDLTERQHVRVAASAEGARTGLEASDFLVTITGNGVGNACVVPEEWDETAFVSQHVGLVRFFDKSLGGYAGRYFIAGGPGNHQILDAQYGQSKPGLSLTNLRELQMGIPPVSERTNLLAILAEADEKIADEKALLDKLRLQKSGLMDDLLTGRKPVTALL